MDIKAQLLQIGEKMVTSVIDAAPRVVVTIVVVVVALIAAKIIERVMRTVLERIKFDALVQKIGVDQILARAGIAQPPSSFLPRVVYFLVLFLAAQSIAESMGLRIVADAIAGFLAYLPNLMSAILVIIVGSLLAQYVGGMITRAARESGIDFAPALGSAVSGLVFLIAAIMSVAQLKIDTDIVRIVAVCLLAGFALAFGLSFGLGTREFTRNIIAGFYAKKFLQAGDQVELRGKRGVVSAITPVQTLVQSGEELFAVSNSALLDEVVKH